MQFGFKNITFNFNLIRSVLYYFVCVFYCNYFLNLKRSLSATKIYVVIGT